jgi:hypothetical protein
MTRDCPRLLRGKSVNTGVPHAHPSIELLYARGREGFTKKKEMSGSKSKHHGLAPKTGGVLITCRLPSPACAGEGPCWRVIGRRSDFAPSATLGDRERTRDGHGGGLGSYTGERAHVSRYPVRAVRRIWEAIVGGTGSSYTPFYSLRAGARGPTLPDRWWDRIHRLLGGRPLGCHWTFNCQ